MGEIKSTLDLVMERTRHLSLSDEEKAQQNREEFEKRLQGLLQQYEDGAMTVDSLQHRISDLQNELKIDDDQMIKRAIFGRIDPDQDNQRWMELIPTYVPAAAAPIQSILADYHLNKKDLLEEGQQQQGETLRQAHHIQGKAVIPNPHKATHYQQGLAAIKQETLAKIVQIAR